MITPVKSDLITTRVSFFGKIGFQLLYVMFGCAWPLQALAAETAPDWAELGHAKSSEQRALLENWARKVRSARDADPKWRPDENWRAFLAQLARTPLEYPELCEFAASIFRDIGKCSDECLAFCDAWTQCKDQQYWQGLYNQESIGPVAPEVWRKKWDQSDAKLSANLTEHQRRTFRDSTRRNIVWSIAATPEASDAAWVLAQAVKEQELQQDVLLSVAMTSGV